MKIYYSPYYNGHTYVDYEKRGGLLGECIESTAGLLSRLELMSGMSYPDWDIKERRTEEYYHLLKAMVTEDNTMYESLCNDDSEKKNFGVTEELLKWRDTLILAGWDRKTQLHGKLKVISDAEKGVVPNGNIAAGEADRWFALKDKISVLKGNADVEVRCPKILIPRIIRDIIAELMTDENECYVCECTDEKKTDSNHFRVVKFTERYEIYQWLALQKAYKGTVVACGDGQRLDNIMRCFCQSTTSGDAQTGCLHVVTDVRSMLDNPKNLIWADCSGCYAFNYPYYFMTEDEKKQISVPSEEEMTDAVRRHYMSVLNSAGNVTLLCAGYDTAEHLAENPVAADLLHGTGSRLESEDGILSVPEKEAGNQIKFTTQKQYCIDGKVNVAGARMSYSTLDTLIQHPFNYVVEKELGLYEPWNEDDVKTEKGKVAHRVVKLMVEENGKIDISKYDVFIENALKEDDNGNSRDSILLLDENKFELEDLIYVLKESLEVLQKIIDENKLTVVGSEVEIPKDSGKDGGVELDTFGKSMAKIDMILKNKKDEYLIFDFKYSESNFYEEKLEKGTSVQFAFYKEIFEKYYNGQDNNKCTGKKLKAMGYYLFPKKTLYVPEEYSDVFCGDYIQYVSRDKDCIEDTLKAVKIAFGFRERQFEKGVIEEGENMDLDKEYSETEGIFPLSERNKKSKKDGPYKSNHIVLKNQID